MSCPFCSTTNSTAASFPRPTQFNGKLFRYLQCQSCSLVYISPMPDESDWPVLYPISYHETFYFSEETGDYSLLYGKLQPFLASGNFLDYGCGDGAFIRFMASKGFHCTGTEYNAQLVNKLRQAMPTHQFYTLEEFQGRKEQYDLIHLGDVLEHIPEPQQLLAMLLQHLSPGGLLLAHGPLEDNNSLGLVVRKSVSAFLSALGKRSSDHRPYHLTFSNRHNQKQLFERSGFQTQLFEVYETPWPYPGNWSWRPATAVKYLIGKSSVLMSRMSANKMGNRFVYIGKRPLEV